MCAGGASRLPYLYKYNLFGVGRFILNPRKRSISVTIHTNENYFRLTQYNSASPTIIFITSFVKFIKRCPYLRPGKPSDFPENEVLSTFCLDKGPTYPEIYAHAHALDKEK